MTWKIQDAQFLRAVVDMKHAPEPLLPSVAFAGRSNVGKSSLINAMLGGRKLARTSGTPGCTQQIIYFGIEERFYFIDLPGYGYAKAPLAERNKWGRMMQKFFEDVKDLRLVVMLLDVRREPTSDDLQMIEWLEANGRDYIFAVTKCDKLTRNERAKRLKLLQEMLGLPNDDAIIPVSAHEGSNIDALLNVALTVLEAPAVEVEAVVEVENRENDDEAE